MTFLRKCLRCGRAAAAILEHDTASVCLFDSDGVEINTCPSQWLRLLKCECKVTWHGCELCNWRCTVNGSKRLLKGEVGSELANHALSSMHKKHVIEIGENDGNILEETSENEFADIEHGTPDVAEVGTNSSCQHHQLQLQEVTPYGKDLIYFGKLELQSTAEPDNNTDFDVDTFVFVVPGKRVWRLERTVQGNRQYMELGVDSLYTVVADDYKVLSQDGSVQLKDYSKSLWKSRN